MIYLETKNKSLYYEKINIKKTDKRKFKKNPGSRGPTLLCRKLCQ